MKKTAESQASVCGLEKCPLLIFLPKDGRAMSIYNFLLLRPCTSFIAYITKPLQILYQLHLCCFLAEKIITVVTSLTTDKMTCIFAQNDNFNKFEWNICDMLNGTRSKTNTDVDDLGKLSLNLTYHKVESSNTSCLEAHAGFFWLLMKGIFNPHVLSLFDKKLIS